MKNINNNDSIVYGIMKVGSKGQVAIPKDLREELAIKQGDQLLVARRPGEKGFVVIKVETMDELVLNFKSV